MPKQTFDFVPSFLVFSLLLLWRKEKKKKKEREKYKKKMKPFYPGENLICFLIVQNLAFI